MFKLLGALSSEKRNRIIHQQIIFSSFIIQFHTFLQIGNVELENTLQICNYSFIQLILPLSVTSSYHALHMKYFPNNQILTWKPGFISLLRKIKSWMWWICSYLNEIHYIWILLLVIERKDERMWFSKPYAWDEMLKYEQTKE